MSLILEDFQLETQADFRLCWAAVSLAIAAYYRKSPQISQIEFAKKLYGESYNRFSPPEAPLIDLGIYQATFERPLNQAEIIDELTLKRPIAACMKHFVGWHLIAIYGIDQKEKLYVADPLYGDTVIPLNQFTLHYLDEYQWTHTYKTQAPI